MATKSAKETGGMLTLEGMDNILDRAYYISFSERPGGGNNFSAYIPAMNIIKLADGDYKKLADSMAKRKYMNGELKSNEVGGSSADKVVKLENARITSINNYGDSVGITIEVGKVTDGSLIAVEDWNSAVKK